MKGHFKEISEKFNEKKGEFEIRYLKGIMSGHPKSNMRYAPFYHKFYG